MLPLLPHDSDDHARQEQYTRVIARLQLLVEGSILSTAIWNDPWSHHHVLRHQMFCMAIGETDLVAVMSTCACELHHR